MFTALSERLTAALKRLTGRGVLSEQDVTEALREIRRHLLEADVSFEVTTGSWSACASVQSGRSP